MKVAADKCDGCGACVIQFQCPKGAISLSYPDPAVIDEGKCSGCGECKNVCQAIMFQGDEGDESFPSDRQVRLVIENARDC